MRWDQLGGSENLDIGEIDLEEICARVSEEPVTLPLIWNFDTALNTCKKLGNGKITGFLHPENISEVDFHTLYGNEYKGCKYFWTPYSDEKEEGHYCNVYTGEEISSFAWGPGQPNGERIENILGLDSRINKFKDKDKELDVCVSCTVPHKVVYMRGVCKHSYLGMLSCPTLQLTTICSLGCWSGGKALKYRQTLLTGQSSLGSDSMTKFDCSLAF